MRITIAALLLAAAAPVWAIDCNDPAQARAQNESLIPDLQKTMEVEEADIKRRLREIDQIAAPAITQGRWTEAGKKALLDQIRASDDYKRYEDQKAPMMAEYRDTLYLADAQKTQDAAQACETGLKARKLNDQLSGLNRAQLDLYKSSVQAYLVLKQVGKN